MVRQDVTWEELGGLMEKVSKDPGGRQPYGFSKACLIAYTMTRGFAERNVCFWN